MKNKIVKTVIVSLAAGMLLSGCASNDASNEYITVTGYKGVEIEDIAEPGETTDEDVESYIQSVMSSYGTDEEIKDRAAENGDTVNVDFVGTIDGVEFDGGSATGQELTIGAGMYIEGFEESIIGHMPGEVIGFDGAFPEDYWNADYAEKACHFDITLNYIKGETILPELDDEFVQTVSTTSKTVEEYKKEVKDMLESSKTTDYETQLSDAAWSAVFEAAEVKKYPDGEVEEYIDKITEQYKQTAEAAGASFAEYLEQNYGMTEEQFEEQAKSASEYAAKEKLLINAIAEKEKLMPSDEKMKEEIDNMAKEYGYEDGDSLIEVAGEDNLKTLVVQKKVRDFLAKNAIQVKK